MKLKMFRAGMTLTGRMMTTTTTTTMRKMGKAERIHGPIASLSNLHEMFLVSFKKRFSENREIGTNCT